MNPLDLAAYKTPAGAAKRLYKFLQEQAVGIGQLANEVSLHSPVRSADLGWGKAWHVTWEGGPYEWAVWLSGGASMFTMESVPANRQSKPEVVGLSNENWHVEPYYSFNLGFWP